MNHGEYNALPQNDDITSLEVQISNAQKKVGNAVDYMEHCNDICAKKMIYTGTTKFETMTSYHQQ